MFEIYIQLEGAITRGSNYGIVKIGFAKDHHIHVQIVQGQIVVVELGDDSRSQVFNLQDSFNRVHQIVIVRRKRLPGGCPLI